MKRFLRHPGAGPAGTPCAGESADTKANVLALRARYSLSKRTAPNATAGRLVEGGTLNISAAAGLRHFF